MKEIKMNEKMKNRISKLLGTVILMSLGVFGGFVFVGLREAGYHLKALESSVHGRKSGQGRRASQTLDLTKFCMNGDYSKFVCECMERGLPRAIGKDAEVFLKAVNGLLPQEEALKLLNRPEIMMPLANLATACEEEQYRWSN